MVTTVTALPEAPSRGQSGDDFDALAEAWVAALGLYTEQLNTLAQEIAALAGADFTGTSSTSLAIATGSKAFTTQTALSFSAGQFIIAASVSGPTNYMTGNITSYDSSTGALVMNSTAVGGSGTKTDWAISLIPPSAALLLAGGTMTGGLVLAAGTTSIVPLRFVTGVRHSAPTHGDVNTTATYIEIYINGVWYQFAPIPQATASQVWTGTSQVVGITPYSLFQAADEVALTDGATVTPDFNTGFNFTWTMAGSRALADPINLKDGQRGSITITQDATGGRTITSYGSKYRFPGGAAAGGVLSTPANSVDVLNYHVKGGVLLCTLVKAFAA